ncbi:MAG: cysteine dioxygenase family protein [Bacteroidia bacterium]|jgi:cysteine dioxygenase|tara:strand:- start:60 stop:608 length:549 start_codon:yes stop_codon:yes gene_type:complete
MINQSKSSVQFSALGDLVNALNDKNYVLAVDQAHKFVFAEDEFEQYAFWNENHYTRNCIAHNESFELILLCWQAGQKTANHCHNGQECWVKVISGKFEEEMYVLNEDTDKLTYTETKHVSQHEVTSVDDHTVFHTLRNTSSSRAMSLHLYMKPIEQCRYIDEESKELRTAVMNYYSVNGEKC